MVAGGRGEVPDFAAGDFTTTFNQGAKRAVTAFSAGGVMDKTMRLPFGDLPGGMFVLVAAVDTFTHGWDLAKATGQATDLNPLLATRLLENARAALPDELRGPEGQAPFGPRVEIAEPSCPADELAGFLGRQP